MRGSFATSFRSLKDLVWIFVIYWWKVLQWNLDLCLISSSKIIKTSWEELIRLKFKFINNYLIEKFIFKKNVLTFWDLKCPKRKKYFKNLKYLRWRRDRVCIRIRRRLRETGAAQERGSTDGRTSRNELSSSLKKCGSSLLLLLFRFHPMEFFVVLP